MFWSALPSAHTLWNYYIFSFKEENMKTHQHTTPGRPNTLRPIDNAHKPVAFRTIIKCRNQSNEHLDLPHHQQHIQSQPEQRYSSAEAADRTSEHQSPIRQMVKQHLKKPSLNLSVTQRTSMLRQENTDLCNQSKLVTSSRLEDSLLQSVDLRSGSLVEELKKRVAHLLELNLERCRLIKGKREITEWIEQKKALEVQAELLAIQEGLRGGRDEEEGLADILAKIEVLEAAMAGQAGESESLKRSYYGKKNQFYNTTSHLSKNALRESLKLNVKYNNNILACQQVLKKEILKCSSSSNQFYKAPKRQFYASPVKNPGKYEPNRFQLPLSSYSKDFLNYQSFPTFPKQLPDGKCLPNAAMTVKNSSYQAQFNDRSAQSKLIDYRELDCAKNKLKSININFMESSCKPKQKQVVKQGTRKEKAAETRGDSGHKAGICSADQFYKTENSRNYGGGLADCQSELYRALPKNKQLLLLKQNFKLLTQAL